MKSEIQMIEDLITQKEGQLFKAESESNVFNSGKYKSHSNAQISKILVDSFRKEIAGLYKRLEETKNLGI